MSDIKQPKLVLDEETSRFAHFKKSIRKPPGLWARKGPTDTAQVYTWSAAEPQ